MKEEINKVETGVSMLGNVVNSSGDVCGEETKGNIKKVIASLQQQAAAVQETAEITKKAADKDLALWEEFLNGVNNMSVLVEELRIEMEDLIEDQNSPAQVCLLRGSTL